MVFLTSCCAVCARRFGINTQVRVHEDESGTHSELHVKTLDRPGLLTDIVKTLKVGGGGTGGIRLGGGGPRDRGVTLEDGTAVEEMRDEGGCLITR